MELLLNKAFGGFEFSSAFYAMYEEKYGYSLKSLCKDEDGDFGYFPISVRIDEKVISLFKELGAKISSAFGSELELIKIKTLDSIFIVDYDGVECCYVASSYDEAYAMMLNDLVI